MEKTNVVPVHKKGGKQVSRNYRPVSLLPIGWKIFECLTFSLKTIQYHLINQVLSKVIYIYQLLSIRHETYQSFDNGFEVRGIFLDIPKPFDKVWHKDLIFKLKQNEVTGDLLYILTNFLKGRKQRVVLNGQHSKSSKVRDLQGSRKDQSWKNFFS